MRCLYCQDRIGLMRRFSDRDFCCDEHRRNMRSFSARVARMDEYEDTAEVWPVYVKPSNRIGAKAQDSTLASSALFGSLILLALVIGSFGISGTENAQERASAGPIENLRRTIREHSAVKLNDDFKSGLSGWTGASPVSAGRNTAHSSSSPSASFGDWSIVNGFIRPGHLRLWTDSIPMSDYQMEFVGQIDKKAMGWAFRATDVKNYYATKIMITTPGPLPTADLVRYAVTNGTEGSRVSLPLPLQIRNDTLYRVQMNVKGDFFSTRVNGQMVDSWTDGRHRRGGVGFFSDSGEAASLRWVSLSNRDDFVGRVLSYFGFWTPYMLAQSGF
jgi:hypothetical protein